MKRIYLILLALLFITTGNKIFAQSNLTAKEIITIADEKFRGKSSKGEMKMTIVRPTWSREVTMKSWSLGDDYMMILITAPARDKGMGFLKRDLEMWNWQPSIDRTIKLPPSMMLQSWMGSDFTNDDLVKQSSIITDYEHKLLRSEVIEGRDCYVIELIPKEDVAVVWGKIINWVDKEEYMQLKTEFYDEDGYLMNTMIGKTPKKFSGHLLPSIIEMIPAEEENEKTVIEYLSLEFDIAIKESFFSVQNMKRVR